MSLSDNYSVSPDGRVWSYARAWGDGAPKALKTHLNADGRPMVALSVNGKRKKVMVHKLVAKEYLGRRPGKAWFVWHKNGDLTDNRAENLAWVKRCKCCGQPILRFK